MPGKPNYREPPAGKPSELFTQFERLIQLPQTSFNGRHPVAFRIWEEATTDDTTRHIVAGALKYLIPGTDSDVIVVESHGVLTYRNALTNYGCTPEHCGRIRAHAETYGAVIVAASGVACNSPYDYALGEVAAMGPAIMLDNLTAREFEPATVINGNGHSFDHPMLRLAAKAIGLFGVSG